jgi:hypothetical protein
MRRLPIAQTMWVRENFDIHMLEIERLIYVMIDGSVFMTEFSFTN